MATKDDLIAAIMNGAQCTKAAAQRGYDELVMAIREGIAEDGEISIHGLGTFSRVKTEARQGRNPSTGEVIQIAAGYRVKFKTSKQLRDQMPAA